MSFPVYTPNLAYIKATELNISNFIIYPTITNRECLGMGSLHIWKGTINAERYIQVLEQHMLPTRRRLFQGRPCIFQHDNARPHTASITTSWLRRRRIRVLKWPACSPDLSPIENIWRIIKRKMRQRRPKTVEQLEAYIRQEWDNIPIPKLEQLVSSVPRRLQTVIKRRGDATQW